MDNESENEVSESISNVSAIKNDDTMASCNDAKFVIKVSKSQQLTNRPVDEEANTLASPVHQTSSTTITPKKKRRLMAVPQLESDVSQLLDTTNPDMLEPDLREFENESKRIRSTELDSDFVDLSDITLDKCFKNQLEAKKAYLKPPINNPLKTKTSFSFNDFINRDMGLIKPTRFQEKIMNSIDYLKRMKLAKTLDFHEGCVNALNFNRIGTLLASSSDDCQVCLWDWASNRPIINFHSGHKTNVFQCKFLPYTGDSQIITSARDGQVRWSALSATGKHLYSKRVAKHSDGCHKIAIEYDSSNLFLTCGEDGNVFEVDLRQDKPAKILQIRNARDTKVPLYSISSHPIDTNEFLVAGKDQFLRFYDKRMLVEEKSKILKKYVPKVLETSNKESITSALYNHNGTEVVASYSDEDIYLFDATLSTDTTDYLHRYKGHRNSETVKGVNFYGATSEFIASGSDCGHIFFWDKNTENIVQCLKGDEKGVVNVIETHPTFPIIATSGLDAEVKIFSPTNTEPNDLKDLPEILNENQRQKESGRMNLSTFEFELLLMLMQRPQERFLRWPYRLASRLMFVRNGDNRGGDHSDENEDDESDQSANHQIDPTDDEDRDSDTILNAFYGSNSYYDDYDDEDDDDDDDDDYDDDDEDDTDDAEGTFDISNEDSDRLNTNSNSATEDRPNSLIFEVYMPSQVSPSVHDYTTTSTQSTVNDTSSSSNINVYNTPDRNCESTDSVQDGRHQSC